MRTTTLLLAALPLVAQGLPPARQQEIEKLITQEMTRQSIPAVSVAVAAGGEVLWTAGYGMADVENFVPARASTVYRTGSVAKPMTAVAVMQLVEAGKIDLDAPIHRYLPTFPHKPWPITIRQLLGHLGGIRHYSSVEEMNSTRHYRDLDSALRIFQDDPLLAEPGTRYTYSTFGYVLLGAAVEHASGMRYVDYLRQRIFQPAGMERTRQDHLYAIIPNRARGYAMNSNGQLQNCSLADTSNKIPGGGLVSTAEDLVRFALALRKGSLVKSSTVEQMFQPQRLKDGRVSNYGLGWFILSNEGRRIVGHTGGQQGVSTMLGMMPREGIAVALMCNLEKGELQDLSLRIARLLIDVRTRPELTRANSPKNQ